MAALAPAVGWVGGELLAGKLSFRLGRRTPRPINTELGTAARQVGGGRTCAHNWGDTGIHVRTYELEHGIHTTAGRLLRYVHRAARGSPTRPVRKKGQTRRSIRNAAVFGKEGGRRPAGIVRVADPSLSCRDRCTRRVLASTSAVACCPRPRPYPCADSAPRTTEQPTPRREPGDAPFQVSSPQPAGDLWFTVRRRT